MKAVFDHIEHTRYLLSQMLESGFVSGRNVSPELRYCEIMAAELGMTGGAELIRALDARFTAFAAGQCALSEAILAYCNAQSYYNTVADMLVIETMSTKPEQN
jgi:hypothetical protein